MGETDKDTSSAASTNSRRRSGLKVLDPAICRFFGQLPLKLRDGFKPLKMFKGENERANSGSSSLGHSRALLTDFEVNLEKQLQAWNENPVWMDQAPEIKVSVPKGSLCNLNVKVNVGLPPDAVYNIVTDPDNKRVFKNIKEVISRRVLVDEGLRQVVELEQAAMWKFLWWSGTISVHVLVDQNRADHTMKFKQVKTGFMKRFEGCWRVEPLFVDEKLCYPFKPKTWEDYNSCTGGKGRIGSSVSLDQLIQPSIVPPPPISWYLRGITSRTTEMLITDLLAETTRIRGGFDPAKSGDNHESSNEAFDKQLEETSDIKKRWALRRRSMRQRDRRVLSVE
ncbi:uncharacterized protein LOC115751307 isoform X2 [Rhodamnia argentea]|uniref:Uncharacterized protein LOC115751307 isoform X2 n=1 Tax=Rhodamnia argentea TaxID=178133 RepID=A0A8B8QEP2_9MYRT|nr:uncharacterized protein LOC115751307 isoform X2 [Rhodamnia argentea]